MLGLECPDALDGGDGEADANAAAVAVEDSSMPDSFDPVRCVCGGAGCCTGNASGLTLAAGLNGSGASAMGDDVLLVEAARE